MPIVCWGALGKAANDPTTIDEAIMAYVAAHDADINAHGLAGYAINVHRDDSPLDHIDYSVTSDKLTINQIVGKDFRTDNDVGPGRDGVMFNPFGIQMYQSGVRRVYIPTSGNAEFLGTVTVEQLKYLTFFVQTFFDSMDAWIDTKQGWLNYSPGTLGDRFFATKTVAGYFCKTYLEGNVVFPSKNPFFEVNGKMDGTTNGFGYFGIGDVGDGNTADAGFGFGEVKRTPYAMVLWGGQRYSALIEGVNTADNAIWRAQMNKQTGNITFFINGHMYATIPDPGIDDFPDCIFMINQTTSIAARRVMNFHSIMFGHTLP